MMELGDLSGILSSLSPDDIGALKSVAQSIFSDPEPSRTEKNNTTQPASEGENGVGFQTIIQIMNVLNQNQNDPKINLLAALKPFVDDDTKKKVDEAAKMLKIVELIPLLREQGIL